VVVVQRKSPTSAWKVDAINAGRSPIGGVEPGLDRIVAESVAAGRLSATHDPHEACRDADVVLVAVQTDKSGLAPEYGPLMDALEGVALALRDRPNGTRPLLIIESTLAPSTMKSVIAPFFARYGLIDGRDVLLGNSPNRVMPGRLVERVAQSDKLVAGLHPETPVLIAALYRRIVSKGSLLTTNSMTAEIVKTLENAYRDVRIAFSAEIARYCDRIDVDFFTLRDRVNDLLAWRDAASWDGSAVPTGALLVPTVGVGGHCLPKDGILLWWRALEASFPSKNSLILASRAVNDASPAATVRLARMEMGALGGRRVAVLGAAYRFDSEDTRNSPSLVLASLLRDSGAEVVLHDPHVPARDVNLARFDLTSVFTHDLEQALDNRSLVFLATAHVAYKHLAPRLRNSSGVAGVIDACNLFHNADFDGSHVRYAGIGRGRRAPDGQLVRSVVSMYRAVVRGVANELEQLVQFLNDRYADDVFNRVDFNEVRRFAATCSTGCDIDLPGGVSPLESHEGFVSGLAQLAVDAASTRVPDPRRGPRTPTPPGLWFGNEDAVVSERDTPWPLTPKQ
jgi:UDP-N-acetyl-D-mannosaminuronic acid dehydrogenase